MQEKWDEYAALLEERLARDPGNAQVLRLKEWAAVARGLPLETEALVTTLIAQGDARAVDLNNLAWSRFARGVSDEQTLEFARRAIAEGGSAASRHTLAALLAVSGRPREAREQILESMGTRGALEPSSDDWLVFGLIAEGYGEMEAAAAYYRRVAPPEGKATPTSSYVLAQKRLSDLAQRRESGTRPG